MEAVAEGRSVRGTLPVRRENGTMLADWSESACGTGRVLLRIYPRQRPGGSVYGISMTTLEALELCLGGRMVRDAEVARMTGDRVPAMAAVELDGHLGPDADRWEARLRARTLEWLGRICFCPASFALAMACCRICCDDRTHPDTLRALERCVNYLRTVPEARARLNLAGRLSAEWSRLAANWSELESALLAECGAGFERSEIGEQTEALLRRMLEP